MMSSMLASTRHFVFSRLPFVTLFLLIIAVIDRGQLQSATPGPTGFTRIARDLGRRFCNADCEGLTHPWSSGSVPR
jgi:hypothetical protein